MDRVGEMPWWAYRQAEEGLAWEQPWLPRVEVVEVPDRPSGETPVSSSDDLAALGFDVREG